MTSDAGGGMYSGWCPVGMSDNQLAMRMNRNSVVASGTTNGAVLMPMVSSTWRSIAPVTVSKNSCTPLGLRTLRWARIQNPRPMMIPPATSVPRIVSTFQATPEDVPLDVIADFDVDCFGTCAHDALSPAHGCRRLRNTGTDAPTSMSTWKTARPTKIPKPSGRISKPNPNAMAVTKARRKNTRCEN